MPRHKRAVRGEDPSCLESWLGKVIPGPTARLGPPHFIQKPARETGTGDRTSNHTLSICQGYVGTDRGMRAFSRLRSR